MTSQELCVHPDQQKLPLSAWCVVGCYTASPAASPAAAVNTTAAVTCQRVLSDRKLRLAGAFTAAVGSAVLLLPNRCCIMSRLAATEYSSSAAAQGAAEKTAEVQLDKGTIQLKHPTTHKQAAAYVVCAGCQLNLVPGWPCQKCADGPHRCQ